MSTAMPVAMAAQLVVLHAAIGRRKVVLLAGGSKLLFGLSFKSRSTRAVAVPTVGINGSLRFRVLRNVKL